jgi:F1F0 ATPase subunit 2
MTMSEIVSFLPAFIVGLLLGGIFFGGLWWTIQKALVSANPALWFICSLLFRTAITVSGFYLIAAGSWQKLLACLSGFLLVRFMMTRSKRLAIPKPTLINKESHHAP